MKNKIIPIFLSAIYLLTGAGCGKTKEAEVVKNFSDYKSEDLRDYLNEKKLNKKLNYRIKESAALLPVSALGLGIGISTGIGVGIGILGMGFKKGIDKLVGTKRDSKIARQLYGYTFEEHDKYMIMISDSILINKNLKPHLVSLFTSYYDYRKDLEKKTFKKIKKASKPNFKSSNKDLDLDLTPYMTDEELEEWINEHWNKPSDTEIVKNAVFEYKHNRSASDKRFNEDYFIIIDANV